MDLNTTYTRHTNATKLVELWPAYLYKTRIESSSSLATARANIQRAMNARSLDQGADVSAEARRLNELGDCFAREVYASLYDDCTELEKPAAGTELLSKAHEALRQLPEWEQLRAQVRGDPDICAIAASTMINHIAQALPKMKQAEQKLKEQQAQEARGRRVRGPKADPDGTLRRCLRAAASDAAQKSASCAAALEGLKAGLGAAPAQHDQEDPRRVKLAERLIADDRLQKAMRLAGRLQRLAAPIKAQRDPNGRSSVVGMELGGDLGLALPAELAAMRPGNRLRSLTLARWADKRLQQYKMEGNAPQGRGPVVVLLDESGSMSGDRHLWASAVALACLKVASNEKRACTIISFNSRIRWAVRLDAQGRSWKHTVSSYSVLPEQTRLGDLADISMWIASSRPGGGTTFDAPVNAALDLKDGISCERSDLVLVTDGQADVNDQTLQRLRAAKEDQGLRCFGLTIGGGSLGYAVNQLCDSAVDLDSAIAADNGGAVASAIP